MAQKEQKRRFYNRIKILVVMLILAGITLHGAGGGIASALGLEQAARCGMEEHIHDEEACYVGTVLTCSKKMHVHSERCYLLLLEDNDINWLLDVVDSTENNTLEAAIDSAVSQAMTLNSVSSENPANEKPADPETQMLSVEIEDEPVPLSSAQVSQLNTVITENGIAPALVLNENLSTAADIGQTAAAMPLALGGQSGGDVSVLAVGGSASTDTHAINFYIKLDGVITFINSGKLVDASYDYDYYSYANTVAAYTNVVVTALTTGNINSTYFFRYNTNGSTTTFDTNATYRNQQVRFGTTSNARYSILSTRTTSGSWLNPTYTYTPVDFYTVTLDYSAVDAENRIQYVQKGEDSTLTLSDEYLWVDKNGNEADASALESIEDTTTLYARPKAYTASFVYKETGATAAASISGAPTGGKLTITMPAAPGGYIWVNAEGVQVTASSVDIKGNTTFYAVPSVCTVRYYDTDGSTELSQFRQENVPYGTSVTLPALPEGASAWSDGTAKYAAGAVVPVTGNMSFTAVTRTLTLNYTLNYTDGDTEYDPSMDVSIGAPKLPNNATTQTNSITAADAPYTVIGPNYRSIHYSTGNGSDSQSTYFLGWDMDGDNVVDIQPGEQLTWAALLALAGDGDTVTLNGVWDPTSINSTISFFIELNARAVDTGGTITGGRGSYTSLLYSTHVFDEQGENVNVTGNYTSVKENGGWVFSLAGDSELTSVLVDSQIRDLYGPGLYLPQDAAKEDQIRLYTLSFPSDQEILDQIREEGKTVYADLGLDENGNSKGREVVDDPDKLTTDYYTIRWYVIKPEGGSWHIDGKLVKKTGTIHVTKNIEGNASLVSAVEDYMKSTAYGTARPFAAAVCEGYYKPDGVTFVNYDSPRTVDLYFVPHGELTGADENNVGYTYDAATKTYSWDFEEVETNELWTITEYPPTAAELKDLDLVDLSEWITVDSISGTGDAGYNTSTSVSGIAHPADETTKAWMRAEFTNMYHKSGNLLLRKLDGVSGINLGSETTFNLFRESVSGMLVPMYFRQTDEGYWIFDSQAGAGSTADLTVDELGYLELEKFTYDAGDIHIRESVARSGYVPAPTVVMGTDLTTDADNDGVYDEEDGDEVSVVLRGYLGPDDELITDEESLRHYADFTQGVLSIRNYSSSSTTVTVQKNWRASENLQSPVQVTLYANGNLASTIPNFVGQYGDYVVWLDGTGSFTYSGSARNSTQYAGETEKPWSHTWRELPSTVDGEAVTWTLVETRIGDEVPDSTGKFPNYTNTVTYTNAVDSDGNLVVNATVTNSVRAAQLFLTKVNESGNALSGATFTLTLLDDSGAADPAWTPRAVTTDSTGVLHFAGLRYETWYRLDETAAPAGYQPIAPIYIKLNSNGAVTATTEFEGFVNHGAVSETGTYTVTVTNVAYPPLPETGGAGTDVYRYGGALLMAAALLILVYKTGCRREDDLPDV